MNDILVIDDFLPEKEHKNIKNVLESPDIIWAYNKNGVSKDGDPNSFSGLVENYSDYYSANLFSHVCYMYGAPTSSLFSNLIKFRGHIQKVIPQKIIRWNRIKINLTTISLCKKRENHYELPHVDSTNKNHYSALYYVNDSDGDTLFCNEYFDGEKKKMTKQKIITPKENRIVIFPSTKYHASSTPIKNDTRLNINMVFEVE